MKNEDLARSFAKVAEVYADPANKDLVQPVFVISTWSKPSLLHAIKAFGGKFTKKMFGDETLYLESKDFPGVQISIPRDKVCKKTITWDCEPMLSPEDIAEVDAATL